MTLSSPLPIDYLRLILTAKVYDVAVETPLQRAPLLSEKLQATVLLKREDLQPVFSFKIRGAYNRMRLLTNEERKRGVVAVSAGNHAQGVAMAAKVLGIPATIVMPKCTPSIKYANVRRLGANVVLFGDDFDEAKSHCAELQSQHGWVNIPPFNDPHVIAGQGTVAVEIMRQLQAIRETQDRVDAIFCCVGGGGLAAGVTAFVKSVFPEVKVFGVEANDSNAMEQALRAGKPVTLSEVGLFAEGAAVRQVGQYTLDVLMGSQSTPGLDGIVLVSNDELCAAIRDVFVDTRTVLEPAGALGVAGMKKWLHQNAEEAKGGVYVAITSGANMNFDRLRFVAERASLGEEKEALIAAMIPEQPGRYTAWGCHSAENSAVNLSSLSKVSFMRLYEVVYPRDVTEFSYRYGDPAQAHIYMSFTVQENRTRSEDVQQVLQELQQQGMHGMDLSENEVAKSHARYLVGGRSEVGNERLFQFTFPERPGALQRFLQGLQCDWNVTLFHYRNFGSDIGKVLVGLQVHSDQETAFHQFLRDLKYPYEEETDNPIYRFFLK